MPTEILHIETTDGVCPATLVTPDGEGPWPGVICYMDAGGVRPAMVDVAANIAAFGYAVLVPEMFYRHGEYAPFDMQNVFSDAGERDRLMSMVFSLSKEMALSDTAAFLDALSAHPAVAGDRVGTTGYCMGGGISLAAAGRFPDRIVAAASFHGGQLATDDPDSPHLAAATTRARVYVAAASDDRSFPAEQEERLAAALSDAGVDHTIETYPAAHGFVLADTPVYDEACARRHDAALEALFGATLTA
ncbi:dienelactone hydrolase family protein [Desertimonas flava]|jgi:carboxymethylenebutenolidase|uniref:dienelactone hydrolase family protein n=1 Tax=Desertimonas flava TaxID=2064846 RepID=UPI000E343CD6|nr:dienelactone hydrolase family protein [Desertimonas flava]